jgi:uncharacterized protein YuzE
MRGAESMADTMKSFRVTYDSEADAAYIYLRRIEAGGVAQTVPVDVLQGLVNLDLGHDGVLVGVEILRASVLLPSGVLS